MSEIKKILVIDDERILQTMLRSVFAAHGLTLVSAYTGEEGLEQAVKEQPDLIVLDVILPGVKGREVCRQLKSREQTCHIPILFLTAKDSEEDVEAELALGAVGHVTKPVNSMALVREVKRILGDQ